MHARNSRSANTLIPNFLDTMDTKIEFDNYTLAYGRDTVLNNITLAVPRNAVLAVFGPAGSGKSGLLRSINRMAELEPNERHQGDIRMDGASIFAANTDLPGLRRRAAMVFAQPVALPMSIYENVSLWPAAGRRARSAAAGCGGRAIAQRGHAVERSQGSARFLGAQPLGRPAAAPEHCPRAGAEPEVLLLDAPTAALDPVSTGKIEDMLIDLTALYDRDCAAQYPAGRARVRLRRILPPRRLR